MTNKKNMALVLAALAAAAAFAEYAPDGGAIVCVNGTNRFTRALYGTCAQSRVETSDFPEAALYLAPHAGTLEMGIETREGFKWMKDFAKIEARFEHGLRNYKLEDGTLSLKVTVAAAADRDGFLVKTEGSADSKVRFYYGGASDEKFARDGDLGTDPWQSWLVQKKHCDKNEYSVDGSAFKIVWPWRNSKVSVSGKISGGAEFKIDEMPEEADGEGKVVCATARLDRGAVIFGVATKAYDNLDKAFADAVEYAAKVSGRIMISTSDPYVNAMAESMALAENGGWDDEKGVYVHGAIGWRMPLNGWRAAYMGDLLGDHKRARTHFDNYAASQVTNVAVTLPPTSDPKCQNAREKEVWGTPMYSTGYICRDPRNNRVLHHYDMNLNYIDELFAHLQYTGDKEYARKVWPVITRHLEWEKRAFDPDGDHLYDAYCCIWASDALQYNGGAVSHSTAYNYLHNKLAADVAKWIGEDGSRYAAEADAIAKATDAKLWTGRHWAEFVDSMGRQLRHDSAALWSEYTPIDSEMGTPEQRYLAAKYMEYELPHHEVADGFTVVSTTDWQPVLWSINNVAQGEIMHAALAHWLAGNDEEAWRIYKGSLLDSAFLGAGPGNFEQLSKYDAFRGECYRDFTDTTACAIRATVKGLFGIAPNLVKGEIGITPRFPASWNKAELETADIDFRYRREGMKEIYSVRQRFPKSRQLVRLSVSRRIGEIVKVTVNGREARWSGDGRAFGVPRALIAGFNDEYAEVVVEFDGKAPRMRLPSKKINKVSPSQAIAAALPKPPAKPAKTRPVDLSGAYNDKVSNLYRPGKYVSPSPATTTLRLPSSGYGDWCQCRQTLDIDDSAIRAKNVYTTKGGVEFKMQQEGNNAAFTSLWDNYPTKIEVPLEGTGSSMHLMLASIVYHMNCHMTNAVVTVNYQDGTKTQFPLILPVTLAPASSPIADTWAMPCFSARRERVRLGKNNRGWADIQSFAIDPGKALKSLELETWTNETVVGLVAASIGE